jgi:hypothetical protein
MAYNPNDGVEIRWGAPENSRNDQPVIAMHRQLSRKMQGVRKWFSKRLHPPT